MEFKYLQFPISLMQEIIKDRHKGIQFCIDYGIGHFALAQHVNTQDVARQVVYSFYRDGAQLPYEVLSAMVEAKEAGDFTRDDDFNGFSSDGDFNPEDNINEVLRVFEYKPDLVPEATDFYKWHTAQEFFKGHIKIHHIKSVVATYKKAKALQATYEAKFGPDAIVSAKPSLLFDFRDDPEQDIDILLAYLGIASLIGYRNFISTTKPVILSRMIGAKSKQTWEAFSKAKEVREIVEKYSKRYQMDRLLLNLAERKFIMYLTRPHVSLLYVSKYMEPEELADMVRQSQEKYNLKNKIRTASQKI